MSPRTPRRSLEGAPQWVKDRRWVRCVRRMARDWWALGDRDAVLGLVTTLAQDLARVRRELRKGARRG